MVPKSIIKTVLKSSSANDLRQVLYRGKQIIKDIAAGLLTLHENFIAHLDIKSPNVLLTGERRGKIADFGLGKMLNGVAANTLSQIGTPAWTCPALLLHGRYSAKSDIWSLSTIMIEVSGSSHFLSIPSVDSMNCMHAPASTKMGLLQSIQTCSDLRP